MATIADKVYHDLIMDIKNKGEWNNNGEVRAIYDDGTPAYAKSVFGKQVVFEEGVIPLLSTKYVGWKTALKESFIFWVLQSVKREDFGSLNVKVWNEWFLPDDTLGKSYAYQFESRPKKEIVKVIRKHVDFEDDFKPFKVGELVESDSEILESKFGKFRVLQKDSRDNVIQFIETGYTYTVSTGNLNKGQIKDIYSLNGYSGHGCLGNPSKSHLSEKQYKKLKVIWQNMLKRCYDKDSVDYDSYGGKGVFVEKRWKCFEFFLQDIKVIPQYFIAKQDDFNGWALDKDYYGANCYSKDACVWLTKSENSSYRVTTKPFYLNIDGEKRIFLTGKECADELGVSPSEVYRYLNKTVRSNNGRANPPKSIKGYTGAYLEDDYEVLYRYKISSNQVVDLINGLINNPMSRRHMTSFWNDADVEEKALQECAMQTTWKVRGDRLDLLLYSRSVDTALGLPFNWIQYWFILQIVAKATGYKAGRFIHQMGDVHYYDRHEETLMEQLSESGLDQEPVFNIGNVDSFFDFDIASITIDGYSMKELPKYQYEVAV